MGAQAQQTPLGQVARLVGEPLGAQPIGAQTALGKLLGGVERALLVPLLFQDGETLMLPDSALIVR